MPASAGDLVLLEEVWGRTKNHELSFRIDHPNGFGRLYKYEHLAFPYISSQAGGGGVVVHVRLVTVELIDMELIGI